MLFAFAFLAALATLYLPGYLAGRSLSLARASALALAPAFTIPLLVLIGIALSAMSISCQALALLGIATAFGLAIYLLSLFARKRSRSRSAARASQPKDDILNPSPSQIWGLYACYVIVALVVCAFMFLTAIDGLDSFARKDDTTVHLSVVRAFLDTGTYSTLHSGSFVGQGTEGGYYPSAWHIVTAIAASCVGGNVNIATNAVTLAFAAVVLPLGICLLLSTVFPQKRNVILAGALFTTTFAILPWGFLTKGQLLPNMAAYALVPAVLTLFIAATCASRKSSRVKFALGTLWTIVAVAFCQPNGAFTCGIWIVAYALSRIFYQPGSNVASFTAKKAAFAGALIAGACLLWAACYFAPPLQSVVTYGKWEALLSIPETLLSGLSFMYVKWGGIQPALSIIVLPGVIKTCRDRRYLWLTVAYAISFVIYAFNMSAEGVVRQIFSGFWYSDYYRTAAMNALFAIPLAALGFAWLVDLASSLIRRIPTMKNHDARTHVVSSVLLVALFAALQVTPFSFTVGKRAIEPGLITMRNQVESLYSWESGYTAEERDFLQQAADIISDDQSLVVNLPNDGSAWSYGTDGLRTLFRRTGDNGSNPFPPETNKLIRTQLSSIATNKEVQQAVSDVDAGYVIVLDDPSGSNPTLETLRYDPEKWSGVNSITPETPGFKLLLSEDDMRLYEIENPLEQK